MTLHCLDCTPASIAFFIVVAATTITMGWFMLLKPHLIGSPMPSVAKFATVGVFFCVLAAAVTVLLP